MTRAFTTSRRQLAGLRVAAQQIGSPGSETPVEVARHLLAMQAQDFGGAKWAIGLRTRNATDADVEKAIENREIVRSWPMRGTLHLTAAEDLGWMLGLTGKRSETARAVRVTATPFAPITAALEPVFARLGTFYGKPVDIL